MITILVLIISTLINIIKLLSPIAAYVIFGIVLMRIAFYRGTKYPWFSWIPIANCFLLGKISDKIASNNEKKQYNRFVLLISSASSILIFLLATLMIFGGIFNAIMSIINIITTGVFDLSSLSNLASPFITIIKQLIAGTFSFANIPGIIMPNLWMLIPSSILILIMHVVTKVFVYISTYNIIKQYDNKHKIIFIVASIGLEAILGYVFVLPLCLLLAFSYYKKENKNINNQIKLETNEPNSPQDNQ